MQHTVLLLYCMPQLCHALYTELAKQGSEGEHAGLSACKCGFVLSSADQDTSPAAKIQSPSSLPLSVSPGSPAGAWSQGLALDLPAMLNTP